MDILIHNKKKKTLKIFFNINNNINYKLKPI